MKKSIWIVLIIAVVAVYGVTKYQKNEHAKLADQVAANKVETVDTVSEEVVEVQTDPINQGEATGKTLNDVKSLAADLKSMTLTGDFKKDLDGSDKEHWGQGKIFANNNKIVFSKDVELTPGPDFHLFLVPEANITNKEDFMKVKDKAIDVSAVKQFKGPQAFSLPKGVDISDYKGLVVWCNTYSIFITSTPLESLTK